jgi:hypothetical protein
MPSSFVFDVPQEMREIFKDNGVKVHTKVSALYNDSLVCDHMQFRLGLEHLGVGERMHEFVQCTRRWAGAAIARRIKSVYIGAMVDFQLQRLCVTVAAQFECKRDLHDAHLDASIRCSGCPGSLDPEEEYDEVGVCDIQNFVKDQIRIAGLVSQPMSLDDLVESALVTTVVYVGEWSKMTTLFHVRHKGMYTDLVQAAKAHRSSNVVVRVTFDDSRDTFTTRFWVQFLAKEDKLAFEHEVAGEFTLLRP